MAEPQFRPPPERRTLPNEDAPVFKVHKAKSKPRKQIFREALISDKGLRLLYSKMQSEPLKGHGNEAADLKRILFRARDWQHDLFPRMRFESFLDFAAQYKTYRYDIDTSTRADTQEDDGAAGADAHGEDPSDDFVFDHDPAEDVAFYPEADEPPPSQITYFQPKPRPKPAEAGAPAPAPAPAAAPQQGGDTSAPAAGLEAAAVGTEELRSEEAAEIEDIKTDDAAVAEEVTTEADGGPDPIGRAEDVDKCPREADAAAEPPAKRRRPVVVDDEEEEYQFA